MTGRPFSLVYIIFAVDILEIQDKYARELLQYLEVLDPGKTWRKNQLVSRLRTITTALAKVISRPRKDHFKNDLRSDQD
jgi:hypothetical protein